MLMKRTLMGGINQWVLIITAELNRTIFTTQNNNSNSSNNLNNDSYNITQICLISNLLYLLIEWQKEQSCHKGRKGDLQRQDSLTLCCLRVCARLPPGRCSCHWKLTFHQKEKPLPTTENQRKMLLRLLISAICIVRSLLLETTQLTDDPRKMQGSTLTLYSNKKHWAFKH